MGKYSYFPIYWATRKWHSGGRDKGAAAYDQNKEKLLISTLSQDIAHQVVPFDAGEAHVQALHAVGETAVVDAQAVQDGGVEGMDVDAVLDDVVAEIVGPAGAETGLDAAAGHPAGEASRGVVP